MLTADYGAGVTSPAIGTLYESDTSLLPDGRTRVLGYTRDVGAGGVTYIALGHCHNPAIRGPRADPTDTTPLTFRGSWEVDPFRVLLQNASRGASAPSSAGKGRPAIRRKQQQERNPCGSSCSVSR